jgi:HSP20 family protein
MTLIRYNPTTDLFNLHSELDRVFTELSRGLFPSTTGQSDGAMSYLPLDIHRVENALEIEASVPGFSPEEVTVTVDQGVLTIEAQKQQESENNEKDYVRRERYVGRLYRQVLLGEGIDGENIQATFKDGVLKVTAPLPAKPEPKRIPVAALK